MMNHSEPFLTAVMQVSGTTIAILGGFIVSALLTERARLLRFRRRLQKAAYELTFEQRRLGLDGALFLDDWDTRIRPQTESLSDVAEVVITITRLRSADYHADPVFEPMDIVVRQDEEAGARAVAEVERDLAALYERSVQTERTLLRGPSRARWRVHNELDRIDLALGRAARMLPADSPWRAAAQSAGSQVYDQMGRIADYDSLAQEGQLRAQRRSLYVLLVLMALLTGAGFLAPLWLLVPTGDVGLSLALSAAILGLLAYLAVDVTQLGRLVVLRELDEVPVHAVPE